MEAQKSNILSSACASVSFGLAQDCTVMGTSKEWGISFFLHEGVRAPISGEKRYYERARRSRSKLYSVSPKPLSPEDCPQVSAAEPLGCSRRPWPDAAFPCRILKDSGLLQGHQAVKIRTGLLHCCTKFVPANSQAFRLHQCQSIEWPSRLEGSPLRYRMPVTAKL